MVLGSNRFDMEVWHLRQSNLPSIISLEKDSLKVPLGRPPRFIFLVQVKRKFFVFVPVAVLANKQSRHCSIFSM